MFKLGGFLGAVALAWGMAVSSTGHAAQPSALPEDIASTLAACMAASGEAGAPDAVECGMKAASGCLSEPRLETCILAIAQIAEDRATRRAAMAPTGHPDVVAAINERTRVNRHCYVKYEGEERAYCYLMVALVHARAIDSIDF